MSKKKPLLLGLILGLHSSYPWLHLVFLGSLLGDPQLSAWFVTRLVFGSFAPWLHLWFLGWLLGSHSSSSVPRLHWDCVCNTRHDTSALLVLPSLPFLHCCTVSPCFTCTATCRLALPPFALLALLPPFYRYCPCISSSPFSFLV